MPEQLAEYVDFRLIHKNERHSIYRARRLDGQPVVVKTAADEAWTASTFSALRHEYEVLAGLAASGVVRIHELVPWRGGLALVTLDAGPRDLADHLRNGPLPVREFLEIAPSIAAALAAVHDTGCIHRDINPRNIVLDDAWNACLIDFEFATMLRVLDNGGEAPRSPVGTLPYIAPEQTGRTGRTVDQRADLYSLGATFYEMLVGAPPFGEGDALALVHAHLTRMPQSPSDLVPGVPRLLSELVLKLLAKAPEARYQTAHGVVADLLETRRRWSADGHIASFPLGRDDVSGTLRLPERIYGREPEAQQLVGAFERASAGPAELLLVTGAPGIGKSALLQRVHAPIAERRGTFIAGKFDQLRRGVPYAAVANAFHEFVRQVLAGDETEVAEWQQEILAAVGSNGQILVDLVPDMGKLLGPLPPLLALGPDEAAHRSQAVLTNFVRAAARADAPLVLFLDDLQWIDAASLRFLEAILGAPDMRHLLVLGAYRDEEVGPTHPLAHAIGALREKGVALQSVHLGPLSTADIAELCADAFGCPRSEVQPLAELLARKTAGNPFFLRRLLRSLVADDQIRFDRAARAWRWDVSAIAAADITDNVLELMTKSMARLPPLCRRLLGQAACIGNRFDLRLLAELAGCSQAAVVDALFPALEEGMLQPVRDAYQAPRREGAHDALIGELQFLYRFVHDRVQQAAYALADEPMRREAHLRIGRSLLAASGERLFDAVDHLNLAESLIAHPGERVELAALNCQAGKRAKDAGAFRAALDYLKAGVALLPPEVRRDHAELAFALTREQAEAAYLAGEHARADGLIEQALAQAPSPRVRAELYLLRINVATCEGDVGQAIEWMRMGLLAVNSQFPRDDLPAAAAAALADLARLLAEPGLEAFARMPLAEDPLHRLQARLLATGAPAAWASGDNALLALIQARLVVNDFAHGHTEETPFALAAYALVHAETTGDHATAHAIGQLGVQLARARPYIGVRCVTLHIFATHVQHWREPLRAGIPLFREAIRYGVESGEHKFASFAAMVMVGSLCELGCEVAELVDEAAAALELTGRTGNRPASLFIAAVRQFARCLQGSTRPGTFDDDGFDETRFIAEAGSLYPTAVGYYWIRRLAAAVMFGEALQARRMAELAEPLLKTLTGFHGNVDHAFYSGLALATVHDSSAERGESLERLRKIEARLAEWARYCPENVEHRRALVAAEIVRIDGDHWNAASLYDRAIDGARANGFVHDEALANEIAGRFFLGRGARRIARMYLQAAVDAYGRWGATGKTAALREAYRDLLLEAGDTYGASAGNSASAAPVALDAISLVRASQAISSEIVVERLLEKLMHVLIEAAGAEQAVLLVDGENGLEAVARASSRDGRTQVSLERGALARQDDLPVGVVQLVWRTQEPVVLRDAMHEGPFTRDAAVRARQVRSVLCVPVPKHAGTAGVMYLENKLTPHAFTRDRVEIVGHLASQLAISLANARFIEDEAARQKQAQRDVERLNAELEERVQARTAELQAANRELDSFSYAVSHDLRAPLRALSSFSQALIEDYGGQLSGEAHTYLEQIRIAAARMGELIEALLVLARSTRAELRHDPVDLSELSRRVTAELEMADPGREIDVDIQPGLAAFGDARMLESVMRNLIGNAWKYTSRTERPRIRVRAEERDGGRRFCVEDNGAGFDMAHAARLFQPFQRLHRQDEFAGTGIGLATVQRIIQRHGGTLHAEAAPGKGATFCFSLPDRDTGSA